MGRHTALYESSFAGNMGIAPIPTDMSGVTITVSGVTGKIPFYPN